MSDNKNTIRSIIERLHGSHPKSVQTASISVVYYRNYLRNIIKGMFDIRCPKDWSTDYIKDCLIDNGVFAVCDTALGVLPLLCSWYGVNVFSRPTTIGIANPVLGTLRKTIGVDAIPVYLYKDNDFEGMALLISMYAQRLATCDCSIDVNLINSRCAEIFECADGSQVESAKKMYDELSEGKPAVFMRKDNIGDNGAISHYSNNVKQNFIATDIIDVKRSIINEFLTVLGINNANTDKRERLNSDEVNANNMELIANIDNIQNNLKECSRKVRELFNIDFDISLKERSGNESNRPTGNMGSTE